MIRSIGMVGAITLAVGAGTSYGVAIAPKVPPSTVGKGESTQPLPPGPHLILTVPLQLTDLPPEVDHYRVDCNVRAVGGVKGHGTATGAVSKPPGAKPEAALSAKVDATVGVFLASGTYASTNNPIAYDCSLFLLGTAYDVTTTYVGSKGMKDFSEFPLAPGVPFKRVISGTVQP